MYETMFSPIKLGNLTVPNRIAMTAMGNHMALMGGEASDIDVEFYGARAKGGVGLVITECVTVDYDHGKGNFGQMSADDDRFIPGLKRVADAVHAHGSVIVAQIYHPGRQGIAPLNNCESMPCASAVECQAVHQPVHEMTHDEIKDIVTKFGAAALRLKKAGYDGVEVHGAHGYLITQFLSPYTNRRTDEYGGSLENRARFGREIMEEIQKTCGKDYPILVRLSVDEHLDFVGHPEAGLHLDEGVEIAKMFENYGACCIDVSCGIYETMNCAWEPIGFDEGWKINLAEAVKKAVTVPVIGVSVIRNPEYAEKILKEGKCDIIGSARQFFADPDWGVKAKEGREKEIRRCISCMYCMETLMFADNPPGPNPTVACAINWQGGREKEYGDSALKKDGAGRKVAVIGGGPAGLEAAIVLAKRGFKPVVFEKSNQLGGQLQIASKPPKKEKMLWLFEYQNHMCEKLGVEIKLNTPATLEILKEINPYAVIVAQGSVPTVPEAFKGDNVYTPQQVLSGEVSFNGKRVGVIGSGMTGLETAELIAHNGGKVAIFEMADDIGPGIFFQNIIDIMGRLGPCQPEIHTKHKLVKLDGKKSVFEAEGGTAEFECDAYVLSLGVTPNTKLVDEIKAAYPKTFVVGDALAGGRLEPAIGGGYKAAFGLE